MMIPGGWLMGAVYLFMLVSMQCFPVANADDWLTHGGCIDNRRWARTETRINCKTAGTLSVKWQVNTTGDVTGTPSIYNGVIYFSDWNGSVFAVNQSTGHVIWRKTLQSYGFAPGVYSRTTPVIVGKTLVLGITGPGWVIRISSKDGSLIWKTEIEAHPAAIITGAGTAFRGAYYTGVSSIEESFAATNGYECCSFVGSAVKLNLANGKILWKTHTLPPNGNRTDQYSGAALWGGSPPIDVARNAIYFGSGNNYKVPERVQTCLGQWLEHPVLPNVCLEPDNHFNSIIAFNIISGKIIWAKRLSQFDAWNVACLVQPRGVNCPLNAGPDGDFGLNPAMTCIIPPGSKKKLDVLVAGQKTGVVYALNRDSGEVIWSTPAGPGGELGGISWGIAVDSRHVYVGVENSRSSNFTLLPGKTVTNGGAWVALNINTGIVIWSTANPMANIYPSSSWSMLTTVANGVVFGGSADPEGHMYAMDANKGTIIKDFKAGASIYGGVSVDSGCAFFGKGYANFAALGTTGGGPQKVFALCIRPPGA